MPTKVRPSPSIPDHEVLRKIGGGSYGEVWLARGVTGALRAVKIVWREDFEDERSFEREFEGILKFEPISRDHPGLVHILHVGRSTDGPAFYYYVMELGDDVTSGRDINPIEYEPRTLRADTQQAKGERWDTDECIEIGIRLADALHHLHEGGLAHRDVKPANIIFVNGKAKLADIGLVALRGQRTFVGTEGFVPPEGPGSARADVYSLGKVLYEIATGNDRMSFPELPEDMPGGPDRKRWLELNRVICEICEPRLSKRKISRASELAEALKRIQRGRRRRTSGIAVWATSLMLIGFSSWIGWELTKDTPWMQSWLSSYQSPKPPPTGMLRVFSTPEGADVLDDAGRIIGTTPTPTMSAKVGASVTFSLRKKGYRTLVITEQIPATATQEPLVIRELLEVFNPPPIGELWTDHFGNPFQPIDDHHESSAYVSKPLWSEFRQSNQIPRHSHEILKATQNGEPAELVLIDKSSASAFCAWFLATGIKAGFLTDDHEVRPLRDTSYRHPSMSQKAIDKGLHPFRIKIRKITFAHLIVRSIPSDSQLYLNGKSYGIVSDLLTPLRVKPGKLQILLLHDGYNPLTHETHLEEGIHEEISLVMEKNQSAVFGQPWQNSLGMQFVPLGSNLLASVWETRKSDYDAFLKQTGHPLASPPHFEQRADHPAVNVSRDDAQTFCGWLTEHERKGGRITESHIYRLPTDLEWSRMAGLEEDPYMSPAGRDLRKPRVFPWGPFSFDPARIVANLADESLSATPAVTNERTIPNYNDGFPFTSPVGSFPPNLLGIYDLSGNVQEWVQDDYSKISSEPLGVLRGGGWNTYQMENLYTGSRNAQPPDYRDTFYGFRIVLARAPAPPTSDN
jgi:serine/threonine protein kinase/formylglycine-generating enzyme required for sulfatase activity